MHVPPHGRAARASTSRKISGGSGRRPLRARTGGRSVRSVTVTLLGGTRRSWVGRRSLGPDAALDGTVVQRGASQLHARVDALGVAARCPCRPSRRRPSGRRCPAMIAANLKKANPTYQFRSDRSAPVRCGVPLGDLAPGREAGQRGHRAQRRGALLAGLRPVDEHHPDVGERVAERRHLPVEDRLDPARARPGRAGSCPAGSRRGRCSTAGSPAPSRPAGRRARRGPGRSRSRVASHCLVQRRTWRAAKPSGRPKSARPDRVVVDGVQVGQHVDQAARRPPGAAAGSSA